MTSDDMSNHVTTFEDPISVEYNGVRLWECPPSGQGIVALMALSILKHFDLTGNVTRTIAIIEYEGEYASTSITWANVDPTFGESLGQH